MKDSTIEKFLENSSTMKSVEDAYTNIRTELQNLGYKESEISSISAPSTMLMIHYGRFLNYYEQLVREVADLFSLSSKDLNYYMNKRLKHIEKAIPLKDGD